MSHGKVDKLRGCILAFMKHEVGKKMDKQKKKQVTKQKNNLILEDIAAYAGVSVATVSRVINASKPVSQDLGLRVKHAIEILGFEPKRPKERNHTPLIAFITPEVLNPANTNIITGAQEEANKSGLGMMILDINEDHEKQNLMLLKQVAFDGIILLHTRLEPKDIFALFPNFSLPMVVLGQQFNSPRVHCINTDRETGMYQAAKYLLSLNHQRIAYLSGPPEWELSKVRLKGIQRALDEAYLTLKPECYRWCFPTIEDGFQVTASILSQPEGTRPTAVMAFNDLIAIGAMHAIRTFGMKVPEDISVVGFDNIYLSAHTNPPLTTISQPKYQIGVLAIQKIYNSLQGYETDKGGFTLLECPLIVRDSTAPCKRCL